jgi:hypothetical protein
VVIISVIKPSNEPSIDLYLIEFLYPLIWAKALLNASIKSISFAISYATGLNKCMISSLTSFRLK